MKDGFTNRMGMFKTTLTTLNSTLYKPVWDGIAPVMFTTKVGQAVTAVGDLETFCQKQETAIGGATIEKAREAAEAEDAAFNMMGALFEWYTDHNDEMNAGKVALSRSGLHGLRDQALKDQMNLTVTLAQEVVATGPGPEAYGITTTTVTALQTEIAEFVAVIAMPHASIADRKGHTGALRLQFNRVEAKFDGLDRLVGQFNATSIGREFIAAYQASRVVRDLGAGPTTPPTPPSP